MSDSLPLQSPKSPSESECEPQLRMQTDQDTILTVDQDADVAEECTESDFINQENAQMLSGRYRFMGRKAEEDIQDEQEGLIQDNQIKA